MKTCASGLALLGSTRPLACAVLLSAWRILSFMHSPALPLRVCYVYFQEYSLALLVMIYAKNEKDNLSKQEKKQIRNVIERVRGALSRRHSIS